MNQVILIGRLTRDPELRFIPSTGDAVVRFSLAVNREYSKQKEADFFNIVGFKKLAENCAQYLKKGRLVAINGSLKNNNYEDKNGVKHYNMEVIAHKVEFLEWGDKEDSNHSSSKSSSQSDNNFNGFQPIECDDDIPF